MLTHTDFRIFLVSLAVVSLVSAVYNTQEECGPNQEYNLCGSACPFNCSNPEGPVDCGDDCVEGCFCKAGFLMDDNGTCVNANECTGGKQSICEENEEFLACGTACPLTCSQPEQPAASCGLACSMGCFCKSGYVRNEATNKCVTLDQCPVEQCFNANEVYDVCNAACEPTCQDPVPICMKICSGGCVCAPGFIRDDTGNCVTFDKCPNSNSTDPGLLGKYWTAINKILHLTAA